jgi:hypothetical protein
LSKLKEQQERPGRDFTMVGKRLVKLTNLMDWLNKILPDASVRRSFLYQQLL